MSYSVEFKEEAISELKAFNKREQILIAKQINKISTAPELGKLLGNVNGYNLSGCRKMYVDKKRIRVVYKIVEQIIVIEIIAIGKREDMQVYAKAAQRL